MAVFGTAIAVCYYRPALSEEKASEKEAVRELMRK
jgi:hypothetical protein